MLKENGLTKKEADDRLKQFGLNEIKNISKTSSLKILLRQIKNNFVIYLLTIAMGISFFVGKNVTAYTILSIIFLVIIVGFVQEFRSEKAITALKGMMVASTVVIREGKEEEIPAKNLVPGDIVVLRNGEKIPADCIILEEKELRMNESVLTGECKDVKKKAGTEAKYTEENMVFMGTYVVNGRCVAKVLHTGMNTKFGKIAGLISTTEKELPLQKKVNDIGKFIAIVGVSVAILTGVLMLLRAPTIDSAVIIEVLLIIIAISVAAFPEGFPVVLITTLSTGTYRMARQNAIVNRMSIIETLGETTVICSDKTGTITKGQMTVKKMFIANTFYEVSGTGYESKGDFLLKNNKIDVNKKPIFNDLFINSILCNDAKIERTGQNNEFKISGSATESALLILAAKAGMFKEDLNFKRAREIPFNSDRKMMSVLCHINKEHIVYSKGAPEYLIQHCDFIQKKDGIFPINEKDMKEILEASDAMAQNSFRTIAFAYKKVDTFSKDHFEEGLIFTGLVGMEDPPREEVKDSIAQCRTAGIEVKMITGDNKETALSIGKQIGLEGKLMTGQELDNITDDELSKIITNIKIFARVKPEHKLRIIKALKANGEIVTMTGDGVNDAPALKDAHIGVAMGKNGTDVSRSVADLTLKDDHFSTIVLAIAEGRTIFKNIRKFVTYQLSCNFAELTTLFLGVLLSPLLGWQIPLLLALQILFMNMVTSDLPAITLGLNRPSTDVMIEMPRKNSEILNKKFIGLLVFNGFLMMVFVLLSYFFTFNIMGKSVEYSRTVALFTLIMLEIISAFNFRSFRKGVLTRSPFVNKYLIYASAISILATFIIIYTPLNTLFGTVPMGISGYFIALAFSLLLIIIFDVLKYYNNKIMFFDFEY